MAVASNGLTTRGPSSRGNRRAPSTIVQRGRYCQAAAALHGRRRGRRAVQAVRYPYVLRHSPLMPATRLVIKFGGTSVGSAAAIAQAAEIAASLCRRGHSLVVVTSAMSGVTDALL